MSNKKEEAVSNIRLVAYQISRSRLARDSYLSGLLTTFSVIRLFKFSILRQPHW